MPQYLRVRRRRNASTAAMIQMEGLMEGRKRSRELSEQLELLADLNLQETPAAANKKPRTAVWRRIEEDPKDGRVFDAVLEEESNGESGSIAHSRVKKRRRLTLVDSSVVDGSFSSLQQDNHQPPISPPKHAGYKVLNPVERLVDDSLLQVAAGTKTAAQHWQFCWQDPRLGSNSNNIDMILWCNLQVGNLLHCCALWNDVDTATAVVSRLPQMIAAVDGEGRTPYQVAELSGHDQICSILAAGDGFVFDVYCLDESSSGHDNLVPGTGTVDSDEAQIVTCCELQGGVGYWDDKGELVLEIPLDERDASDQHADDEEDSNSENWDGNDYPDNEDDNEDVFDSPDETFRNCAVNLAAIEDTEYSYDPSYGIYGGEPEYDEEC